MSLLEQFSEQQLKVMDQQELVKIVMKLQQQNKVIPMLERQLDDLRSQVAEQAINQEMVEENEVNTFRRLSVECAQQGIAIDTPQTRAGQSIDNIGSLNDVSIRKEPAMMNLAAYSSGSSNKSSNFAVGSMQPAIQQMSMSLQTQQLGQKSQNAAPLIMGSFTSSGKISSSTTVSKQMQMAAPQPVLPKPVQTNQPVIFKQVMSLPPVQQESSDEVDVVI
ncbi:Conserved_hypothetical protein [Hexamita inflata]|uniref:Uncharacterized protein n=1 Tax=Hexamita inflata TaxID=28002 RepID=A0ABP1JST3_9EUKA